MVRKAHAKPVTAQMYRHFAAVTIAATIALAMISSGENREAVAREVAAIQTSPRVPQGEIVRRTNAPIRHADTADSFDGSFGDPMDTAGSAPSFGGVEPGQMPDAPTRQVPAGFTQFGVSTEIWGTMTPAQRKALEDRRKAQLAAASRPERGEQIEALLSASRARSGGLGPVPD